MDERGRLSIKIEALQRLVMINTLSSVLPLYIVAEYPKSGGSWLAQMLSYYFDVPFPRNQRPKIESCIMHGHFRYSPFMKNVFCMVRDGRDVMISMYYHSLFINDKNSPYLVERTRRNNAFNDYDDINHNLPRFIEYLFTVEKKKMFHFNWNEFIDSWYGKPDVVFVIYSDLIENAAEALKNPIEKISGRPANMKRLYEAQEKFSFQNLSGREPGIQDKTSFLRKGIVGDWKNHFSPEACEVFDHYAGYNLLRLGFEKDKSWIEQQALKTETVLKPAGMVGSDSSIKKLFCALALPTLLSAISIAVFKFGAAYAGYFGAITQSI